MSIEGAGPIELSTQRLAPDHARACHELDQLCRPQGWDLQQWSQELEGSGRSVLGVFHGCELVAVGSSWLILDDLQILLVLVHPGHRRIGLASMVLNGLMRDGRERGASGASLEVAVGNTAALGLYGSLGFRSTGRRRGYYRDGQDALIQWRQLDDTTG